MCVCMCVCVCACVCVRSPNPPTLLPNKWIRGGGGGGYQNYGRLICFETAIFCIMMKTSFLEKMIVCLIVFIVAFKHMRSYLDGA